MNYCKTPQLFNLSIENTYAQVLVSFLGIAISLMTSIHGIIGGQYEKGILDTIVGALLGVIIGFISWYNIAKSQDKFKDDFSWPENLMKILRTIIVLIIVVEHSAENIESFFFYFVVLL